MLGLVAVLFVSGSFAEIAGFIPEEYQEPATMSSCGKWTRTPEPILDDRLIINRRRTVVQAGDLLFCGPCDTPPEKQDAEKRHHVKNVAKIA